MAVNTSSSGRAAAWPCRAAAALARAPTPHTAGLHAPRRQSVLDMGDTNAVRRKELPGHRIAGAPGRARPGPARSAPLLSTANGRRWGRTLAASTARLSCQRAAARATTSAGPLPSGVRPSTSAPQVAHRQSGRAPGPPRASSSSPEQPRMRHGAACAPAPCRPSGSPAARFSGCIPGLEQVAPPRAEESKQCAAWDTCSTRCIIIR